MLKRNKGDVKKLENKRLEDLSLIESSLSRVQEQQLRALQRCDDGLHKVRRTTTSSSTSSSDLVYRTDLT